VLAREYKLCVDQGNAVRLIRWYVAEAGMMFAGTGDCSAIASGTVTGQFLCLLFVLLEAGIVREDAVGHTKLLS
jgi:hypothetical protein